MFKLATVFLLAFALPAQEEGGDYDPPDDDMESHASCSGCGMNLAGTIAGSFGGEQWKFMPGTYSRPGKCYTNFAHNGCTFIGCKFRGRLKFSYSIGLLGGGGARRWAIGKSSGVVTAGRSSGWVPVSYNVGCGQANPPKGLAFDMVTGKRTSGWAFKCEPCTLDDFVSIDEDGETIY